MNCSIMDNILLAHSLPKNTDRRKFLPLSKIRNKKREPPSSTENSKVFDSTKQKSEPPMIRGNYLKKHKMFINSFSLHGSNHLRFAKYPSNHEWTYCSKKQLGFYTSIPIQLPEHQTNWFLHFHTNLSHTK